MSLSVRSGAGIAEMMSGELTVVDPAPLGASGSDFYQEKQVITRRAEGAASARLVASQDGRSGPECLFHALFGVGAEAPVPPPVMDLITANYRPVI